MKLALKLLVESQPVAASQNTKKNPAGTSARLAAGDRPYAVPLLDLHRQYQTIRDEVLTAVERVCTSQKFILGAESDAFEREIAAFTGAAAGVACASGTDALWLALVGAGIGPGDSVITTAFSFFASASAIVRAGARPIFVDVDADTLNLDPVQVKERLRNGGSNKVRALLPVHLYGQCADMDQLQSSADEFKLQIIEDAAQAIGAAWRNRYAGSMGRAAAFSFYPTKNLSAYGDAGLVTTNDLDLADHLRRLRNHGSSRRYHHEEFGWNSRLDEIQAAVLRVKLTHLEEWNRKRREHSELYNQLFSAAGLSRQGSKSPIRPVKVASHARQVCHQYVVRAIRRDDLRKYLADRKIGTEIYYPIPLHLQPSFSYLGYSEGDLPHSEQASREVLALPMFPELREDEQRWVVESIAEFYS